MQTAVVRAPKWRKFSVIFGGILIQIVYGTLLTFGNLNPYITSYMRYSGSDPTLTYIQCSWIYVASLIPQAAFISLAGMLERKLGLRGTALLGCSIISLGVSLTYFSIQYSFPATVFTNGVMFGIGAGVAYTLPITCAMRWMPENRGLASGLVNAGIGGGALIFNSVETYFINPENKKVELNVGSETYFDQPDVIEMVPYVFLLLGGTFAAMQLLGCLLLSNPPSTLYEETTELGGSKEAEEIQPNFDDDDATIPLLKNEISRHKDDERRKKTDCPSILGDDAKISPLEKEYSVTLPMYEFVASITSDKSKEKEEDEDINIRPVDALKTVDFYLLFFVFFFSGLGNMFLNSFYKAFGLSFINDDVFLSLVGTVSSVFNSTGRTFWGFYADKTSFRFGTIIRSCLFICLMLTFQVTQLVGKPLFMIYVCLLQFTGIGTSALVFMAAAKRFGKKYLTTTCGLLFISQSLIAPVTTIISQGLLTHIGWTGLFFVVAGLYCIGLVLTILFKGKDKNGREI